MSRGPFAASLRCELAAAALAARLALLRFALVGVLLELLRLLGDALMVFLVLFRRALVLGLLVVLDGLRDVLRAAGVGQRLDRLRRVVDDLLHVDDRLVDDRLVLLGELARVEGVRTRRRVGRARRVSRRR